MSAGYNSLSRGRFFIWTFFAVFLSGLIMSGGCQNGNGNIDNFVEFGIIADTQYAEKDNLGARNYREAILRLEECVVDFNNRELAFVIQLGDIIDGGDNAAEELERVTAVHNRLKTVKYHVTGNHDFWVVEREAVLSTLGMEKAYYDFSIGRWRFLVLDTMDIAVSGGWPKESKNYLEGEKLLAELTANGAVNAVDWSGGIGEAQKRWLGKILSEAEGEGQKVIVFGHVPLLPADDVHNLWNSDEIVKIFESCGCVSAYFCGHRHGGGYFEQKGIHYITVEGMVEAGQENAYGVVRLCGNRVEIKGTGGVVSRTFVIGD
jgi:manganese-dependent ADP-ribose/CDP-alcohol diphosphatase